MTADGYRAVRELLGAYALGQLTGEQYATVHEYLRRSPELRAELAEIAPVVELLSTARGRLGADDPAGVEDGYVPPLSPALLAEVGTAGVDEAGTATPAVARARSRWARRVPVAAAASAALVVGGIGFALAATTIQAPAAPAVSQENVVVRALDPGVQAQAGLVPHTWGMEVKLVATGFEEGAPYRVTVIDDRGRTVGAGEFIGTGAQEMRCNLNSSILRAAAATVLVTGPDGDVVLDAVV